MSVLYTVGFSGKDAKTFFELLKLNDIRSLLDVRPLPLLAGGKQEESLLAAADEGIPQAAVAFIRACGQVDVFGANHQGEQPVRTGIVPTPREHALRRFG